MSSNAAPKRQPGAVKKKVVVISMITLAIMNVTTVMSLRGLPSQAVYGLNSIFYFGLAAVVFLIPVALVAAELASTFPEKGGVFRWIGEAFGPAWGFAALYYEWQSIVVWFPTVLIFAGVAFAYIFGSASFDSALAANKFYVIAVVLLVFWSVTLFTFRGIQSSSKLSTLGGLIGTIIPGAILILAAGVYVVLGNPVHLDMTTGYIPKFNNISTVVLAGSIFLFFAGMEMQAVHITDMKNPSRDYPLSLLIATVVIVAVFVLGTLAIAIIVPQKDINLTQSLLVAFRTLWTALHVPWMGNVMAAMLAFGVLGQVSVIIAGPSTGLLAVGKGGYLPKFFQRTNKNGIQVPILVFQGIVVSVLALALTVLPSVQSAYQILSQMATVIILVMYLIMYAAALRLRHTQPNKHRPFKIPGNAVGIWLVGGIGFIAALGACVLSFIPPTQIATGSPVLYIGILVVGSAIFLAIPFVIYAFRKPEWKAANADFAAFDWQIEGRTPSEVSKWPVGHVAKPVPVPNKAPSPPAAA
jgi:putative glutamate/gamma-aminobutyrate antiporter